MRVGRLRLAGDSDFAVQNEDGAWVTFSSMGIVATDTFQVIACSADVQAGLSSGIGTPLTEPPDLLRPVLRPSKMLGIGLNYMDHIRETGAAVPDRPILFAKFPNSLNDPYGTIVIDRHFTQQGDYEAELAVVMGKKARHVQEDQALDFVYGYCVANDVSARDLQRTDAQFSRSKGFDTFCPIGPWITTSDEVQDPQNLNIRSEVNGETRQESNTREMIFSVASLISFLSDTMTLEPGDVILTGTPHGVGFAMEPPIFLGPGDRVTCAIEGLGHIENRVEAVGQAPRAVVS